MADAKPIKPATAAIELAIANCFMIYFTTNALIDYSAVLFAQAGENGRRLAFYGMYRQFRMAPPIACFIDPLILPLLPFIVYMMIKSMVSSILGWQRAYLTRHLVDITQGIVLPFLILPCVFTRVLPQGSECAEACALGADGRVGAICQPIVDECEKTCLFMLIANLLMFLCEIIRYRVGALEEEPTVAAEEEEEEEASLQANARWEMPCCGSSSGLQQHRKKLLVMSE